MRVQSARRAILDLLRTIRIIGQTPGELILTIRLCSIWTGMVRRDRLRGFERRQNAFADRSTSAFPGLKEYSIVLIYLMILLTMVPLVELMILLRIARAIDWLPTIGLVIVTGVLGAWLARREGFRVWRRIEEDLAKGTVPAQAMLDGGLILLAGVVLITPGILTDLCGFALLIAPIRNRLRKMLVEAFNKRIVVLHSQPDDSFVDVTATSTEADQSRDEPAP